MKLSITPKRWLLIVHILFAAIMFGNMVTFLILSITVATTDDGKLIETSYQIMYLLSGTSIKASTIGATVSGVLLSVWTKWGLFKFYWIIAKQGLTVLLIGLNLWGMLTWTLQALTFTQMGGERTDIFLVQAELWTGIIIQLLSLVIMFAISVFKPWGRRVVTP
ncbi:hypothetical protein LG329_09245 [Virgibacillus necropolis]|uniref:hypothetical protein n=1 Tax=Virgibacillus necropolis TaxID=163877 RepID=UPI00384B556E